MCQHSSSGSVLSCSSNRRGITSSLSFTYPLPHSLAFLSRNCAWWPLHINKGLQSRSLFVSSSLGYVQMAQTGCAWWHQQRVYSTLGTNTYVWPQDLNVMASAPRTDSPL